MFFCVCVKICSQWNHALCIHRGDLSRLTTKHQFWLFRFISDISAVWKQVFFLFCFHIVIFQHLIPPPLFPSPSPNSSTVVKTKNPQDCNKSFLHTCEPLHWVVPRIITLSSVMVKHVSMLSVLFFVLKLPCQSFLCVCVLVVRRLIAQDVGY